MKIKVGDETVTDIDQVMEKWKSDFSSLFASPHLPHYDDEHLAMVEIRLEQIKELQSVLPHAEMADESFNRPISREEVEKSVFNLKDNRSTGLDSIPAECLKNRPVIDILHKIYSYCFENSVVPENWLHGIISPIYKQGDTHEPLNYRGITLINVIGKCYSFILNRRLTTWIEENGVLNDEQNGFRRARSCLDHMYVLYSIVKNRILTKRSTFACFIDAKKAFDRVSHSCLWYKLYNAGVQGKIFLALQSLYKKGSLKSCVRINDLVTDDFNIDCSVRQGDPTSPTLFSLYVNDLIDELNASNNGVRCGDMSVAALFYADDVVVLSETAKGLQNQLDIVSQWCSKWRMEINQSKTKILHFRPKSVNLTSYSFQCGTYDISVSSKYKYLGLVFNDYMDESVMVDDVAKCAARALGAMITKYNRIGGNMYETFTKFYECYVNPVMLYGASLWGSREYGKLNTIQNRACKYFLGLPKCTSNVATHGEIGWLSVQSKQKMEMIRLWCRFQNMDKSRLTYKIHKWSLSMSNRNIKSIEYYMKCNLRIAGLFQQATNVEKVNTKAIILQLRRYLQEYENSEWYKKLWNDVGNEEHGNKLRLYRTFKDKIMVESYVMDLMPYMHRKYLAMFRCGSLPLEVELGRRRNLPLDERLCPLCKQGVEDEVHILLQCPVYDDLREDFSILIPGITQSGVDVFDQFISIMSNDDIQADVGNFIFKVMKRREQILEVL